MNELLPQALKGLMCALGAGSGISKSAAAITYQDRIETWKDIYSADFIAQLERASAGCILSISSKLVAELEGVMYSNMRLDSQISRMNHSDMILWFEQFAPGRFSAKQIYLLDRSHTAGTFVLGPADPNQSAHNIAESLRDSFGVPCDVVLIDSGAGRSKGTGEIGIETYIATPIGSTAGLSLAHTQRFAAAGEFLSNSHRLTPITIFSPESDRSRCRNNIGDMRYSGYLDASRERVDLPYMREEEDKNWQ